ncbi:hypothetical protein BV25DRAFT_1912525 [Artomyces pyxidatus]|uniref:Uncharacterized protein n=1 Tax=Artomyces pyxidatus TaxID=48021 RepID=A0ACB8TD74_9AGAM|nr:hypothetical protein BV25DRAFT_1912525 [Artomyces pyxidatus]
MTLLAVFAAAFLSLAAAAPLASLELRDVYTPPVLYPHAGTVWKIGNHHNVTWNTTDPPKQITNPIGQIYLTKNLINLNISLASGFNILDGRIVVKVPDVTPGDKYAVVLFGDSGNFSPFFTITH